MTSLTKSSKAISGTYDLKFKNSVYASVPVNFDSQSFENLLQASPEFGYARITVKSSQCSKYSYEIEWSSIGMQPLLVLFNNNGITPENSSINIRRLKAGYAQNSYYLLPSDMLRTFHNTPQVNLHV